MLQLPLEQPEAAAIDLQIDEAYAPHVSAERLLAVILAALHSEDADGKELALVISNDALLHELNAAYRGVDAPTDVLSFPAQEAAEETSAFVTAPEALNYLGDIVISYPTAERQAIAAGHPVMDELSLLAVHGVLHLLGYDHATAEEEADMWARQARVLGSFAV